jgi:hypothetical protein
MPVETTPPITPPNEAYISDLNSDWPTGADFPSDGDDHIRGVKNVLKQTFPNLTGAVTLTQDEINSGSKLLQVGTVCLFYQAVAPVGWTRVNPTVGNRMLIVTSGGAGVEGGDHNPIYNDKVPSHTHVASSSLGEATPDVSGGGGKHTHGMTLNGDHIHYYSANIGSGVGAVGGGCCFAQIGGTTSSAGNHAHTIHTVGNHTHSIAHTHSISVDVSANEDAANWAPRYSACLLARRD